jgi:hypothetical protein
VSVAPPNVVHTSPYVAKALGYFEKRCIDGQHRAVRRRAIADLSRRGGTGLGDRQRERRARSAAGLKVQQIWALAPRMPQAYMVPGEIKSAADLKASGCRRPAAASAASTGGWAARC